MNMKKWIIALIIGMMLIGVALGILYKYRSIWNNGTIKAIGIEVYQDANATIPLTNIEWGYLDPGENKSVTIYVKNEGSMDVTLSKYEDAWEPIEAGKYVSLTWDYDGYTLEPSGVYSVVITLNVDEAVEDVTSFTFSVTIVGS